ncbi:MAG: SH3 domain-containing protein [Pseudomonadota bacterium]
MTRLIIVTFAFLAFAFYELSGGADFDADATRLSRIDPPAAVVQQPLTEVVVADQATTVPENVTRVSLNLTSVNDVLRPRRSVATTPARQMAAPSEDTEAAVSEEEPTLILPSLIVDSAVITTVDFNAPETTAPTPAARDVRAVSARSVNVRGGPGTDYSVVNRLSRGDEVEILQDPGEGWVKLRPLNGGTIGWMADFLLSEG